MTIRLTLKLESNIESGIIAASISRNDPIIAVQSIIAVQHDAALIGLNREQLQQSVRSYGGHEPKTFGLLFSDWSVYIARSMIVQRSGRMPMGRCRGILEANNDKNMNH